MTFDRRGCGYYGCDNLHPRGISGPRRFEFDGCGATGMSEDTLRDQWLLRHIHFAFSFVSFNLLFCGVIGVGGDTFALVFF